MVVNWDHPVVQEKTREITKALAEEFEKSGKFQKVEHEFDFLKQHGFGVVYGEKAVKEKIKEIGATTDSTMPLGFN